MISLFPKINAKLTFLANSGVMIEYEDRKIMVDAVHTQKVAPYSEVSEEVIEQMILNREPYGNIDMLFFSHHHPDHFDAYTTNEMLKRNKHIQVVCSLTCASRIGSQRNFSPVLESQIRRIELADYTSVSFNIKNLPFTATALPHDGEVYRGVKNYVYTFSLGRRTLMHVGDSYAARRNFEAAGLYGKHVDYLIVPFPFIGLKDGRDIISSMKPRKVFVCHLPDRDQDETNWIGSTYKTFKKYERSLPKTVFLTKEGQSVKLT